MWKSTTIALTALGALCALNACETQPSATGTSATAVAGAGSGSAARSAPSGNVPAVAPTSPQAATPGFPGDGTFAVGTDIRPGTYRTAGAAGGLSGQGDCYWERDRDLTGTMDAVIANGNTSGPAIVQILPTDAAFKTTGCLPWTLVATAAAPPSTTTPPSTAAPSAPPAPPLTQPGSDPASVVEAYYTAINAGDYTTAWNLGGTHFASSYNAFVAGYANLERDDVVVTSVAGPRAYVDLTAYNRDGTVQHFTGYYVVTGGVITQADIH